MSKCSIKVKTLDYLKDEGILEASRKVIDYTRMVDMNDTLTRRAYDKYGVGDNKTKLFTLEGKNIVNIDGSSRYIVRAVPHERLFSILDDAVNNQPLPLEDKITNIAKYMGQTSPEQEMNDKQLQDFYKEGAKEMFNLNAYNLTPKDLLDDTITESILFSTERDRNNYTAVEILDNILKEYPNFNPTAKKLIERAKFLVGKTKAKVELVNDYQVGSTALMDYLPHSNTIRIPVGKLSDHSTDRIIKAFIHEVVHSVTVNAYNNPKSIAEQELVSFINEAYDYYKNNSEKQDMYGFSDIYEFIAETMTSREFQLDMQNTDFKNIPQKKQSLWDVFINKLRRVFGLAQNKKIDGNAVINAITSLAEDSEFNRATHKIFKKGGTEAIEFKEATELETDLSSTEKKLENALEKISENIEINIGTYRFLAKIKQNDPSTKEGIEYYLKQLQELQANILNYRENNKALAITIFINSMMNSLGVINSKIENADLEDTEELLDTVKIYNNYLTTFSVIDDIEDAFTDILAEKDQKLFNEQEQTLLKDNIKKARGEFELLASSMKTLKRKGIGQYINDIRFFPEVEYRHRDRLEKEWKAVGRPGDMEDYVSDKILNRDEAKIQEDVDAEVNKLMNNPLFDIYSGDKMFSSAINVSSTLIQIMNQMLYDVDNQRIEIERVKDLEFKAAFEELRKEKGSINIKELYKNIIEYDSKGQQYLKGTYSVKLLDEINRINKLIKANAAKATELRIKRKELYDKYGAKHPDYIAARLEVKKIINENAKLNKELNASSFEMKKNKRVKPLDKWKNDLSTLSPAEKKVLKLFKGVVDEGVTSIYGNKHLKVFNSGAEFYTLPRITKGDVERMWEGDVKGMVVDKWKDFTQVRTDDIDYVNKNIDLANNPINKLKVAYRQYPGMDFDYKDQSMDLMTIFRLEYKNVNRYSIRKKVETELNFMVDIAEDKRYYEKEGTRAVIRRRTGKLNAAKNPNSNTRQMMVNILESKFYDIGVNNNVKLGKTDLNKVVKFVNSSSAFLTLSLNLASGTANVVNANAQLFLETFLKGKWFTAKDIAKAEKIYGADLINILSDVSNPINEAYTNQLMELFNTRGVYNLSHANFLQASYAKAGLQAQSLQVLQNSGEHWVHSVVTMSVLNNIKVRNAQNKYIDKNGNVTTKEKAASLLDMTKKNEEGMVEVDSRVVYTTHSRATRWNEGGKTKIDMLIRKKVYDTLGNYTETDQPEVFRHWLGKLAMLYRKYLVPMGQARLRGAEHSFTTKENLKDYDKTFSYALQEYEEGTYTTLIRYMRTALADTKSGLFKMGNWNNLTEYEKHNIKRSVVEIIMTAVVLPLSVMLVGAVADGDDNDTLFFIAYILRRIETELSAYRNPSEAFKMLRSPIPSARLIETTFSLAANVFQPWNWDEEYKAGDNRGRNKLLVKFYKQIPVVKEFQRKYQDLFEYQNSTFGIR